MNSKYLCSACKFSSFCFFPDSNKTFDANLEKIIKQSVLFHKNDFLYQSGTPFSTLAIIRSGCVKTYKINPNGDKTTTGFCYPGEILGLNAIAHNKYQEHAVALDTVSVCQLDFDAFEQLSLRFPKLQRYLISLMSEQLSNNLPPRLSSSAESKLAYFLLEISRKMKTFGISDKRLKLQMTRQDIAAYLGLATETVSRVLAKFQLRNILECSQKSILLKDYPTLQKLAFHAS